MSKDFGLNEYQEQVMETAIYPNSDRFIVLSYVVLGLSGEAGELAGKLSKVIRDGNCKIDRSNYKDMAKELGDVLWFVAVVAFELGFDLKDIARLNIEKLMSRKERGKIGGDGDDR